jgi:cell division inhibitor SulA/protein ImuA
MSASFELARLLEHPAIWRGRSAARAETLPTGYAALDAGLPGKGWPRKGLIEILVSRFGVGELNLLLPALAALTCRPAPRWCVWISPPLEPYAPALAAHGIALERVLVVRDPESRPSGQRGSPQRGLWAFEQTLGSGAADVALAWAARGPRTREIRRLQLAAERGKTLGVLFRPQRAARESSPAILRVAVEPRAHGMQLTFLKSRGGARGSIELGLPRERRPAFEKLQEWPAVGS